jgi:hypothetical protein
MDNGIRILIKMDYTVLHEFGKFNNIIYHDEPHTYHINNKQLISATTFIGKFKAKFDSDSVAEKFADKNGLDKQDVLDSWDWKRDFSCIKGTLFHKYAEDYLNNKIFPYDSVYFTKLFGVDTMKPIYDILVRQFKQFYEDSSHNLVPVKSEWIVGDEEMGICGTVDQLYFNKKTQMLEIWDWKSNKAINLKSQYNQRFRHPIEHLDMCEMNTYSLQLSLYKYIIEMNTSLRIGNCYIVWFNEKNDAYKIFKTFDYREEIETMVKYAKQYKWI